MAKRRSIKAPTLQFPELQNALSKLFPESGKILLTGGGKEFVERIGVEAIRNAVYSVLCGENLRMQTEPISRTRIAQISGAIIAMFTKGYLEIPEFQEKMSGLAIDQLKSSRGNVNVWPAQWTIGFTGKLAQNVIRNKEELENYIKDFEAAISNAAKHCSEYLGEYNIKLGYVKDKDYQVTLDWEGIARLTTAIGAQTLAIRGSEKSMYGKLFERLVLGSILTIMGFKRVDRGNNKQVEGVFWLSDSSDNRESDATAIIKPGKLARFDIGFIGQGNPEIAKDKLSRFANIIEEEDPDYISTSVTFVIIDKLPQTVKTKTAAEKAGAEVIQMSMQYWPKEISLRMRERFDFKHEIQDIPDNELQAYIKKHLEGIKVQDFLKGVSVEQISNDETSTGDTDVLDEE